MRSEIGKEVRKTFNRKMAERLPQFLEQETFGALRGGLLYGWQGCPQVNCFIYLQMSQKMYQDCFMVELSCSSGEFPIHKVAFDPADVAGAAVRFRLPELYRNEWGVRARRVPWWWIGPEVRPQEVTAHAAARIGREGQVRSTPDLQIPIAEALRDVEPQVDDAISRIERFGIPFFRGFTEKRLQS